MQKQPRGSFDYVSDGNVEVVRWNDNSVVTFCSNCEGATPMGSAQRRVKQKGSVSVPQPYIVRSYNNGMGGVDLLDRALSECRPKINGKKWYWPLIINALNVGLVFCWRLFQEISGTKVPQKQFRNNLATILIKRSGSNNERRDSRPGPSFSVPAAVRTDNQRHYPESNAVRRCAVCKKNCRIKCSKCQKPLHLNVCFQKFHEK